MHELALYGQITKDDHHRMLQQLAGYTRMQPQYATEICLIFRARQPPGLDLVQSIGASNLGPQQQQEAQRVKNMLNAGLYYVHLVGEVLPKKQVNGDLGASNGASEFVSEKVIIQWTFEFKDTPEAGKQSVSSRMVSRTPMEGANLMQFFNDFGFDYVSRYMVVGARFYDDHTTFYVHKVLELPEVAANQAIPDKSNVPNSNEMAEFDASGGYVVKASIDIADGNNAELKDRATRQLLVHKEALKQAVDLTPGDRLALDTRLPANSRRA